MPGPYVWRQFQEGYKWVQDAPPVLVAVAAIIKATFSETVNHFIFIEYDGPKITVANAHHDKDDQWADGASFFNLSFQILNKAKQVVWERALAHNSCLKVDSKTNRKFKHAVPPRKDEAHSKRWSIVCRQVVSSIKDSTDPADMHALGQLPGDEPAVAAAVAGVSPPNFCSRLRLTAPRSIITWKHGTTTHLCDLIDLREKCFYRSLLKNQAVDARNFDLLDAALTWAQDNGVGLPASSRAYYHDKIRRLLNSDAATKGVTTEAPAAGPVIKEACQD